MNGRDRAPRVGRHAALLAVLAVMAGAVCLRPSFVAAAEEPTGGQPLSRLRQWAGHLIEAPTPDNATPAAAPETMEVNGRVVHAQTFTSTEPPAEAFAQYRAQFLKAGWMLQQEAPAGSYMAMFSKAGQQANVVAQSLNQGSLMILSQWAVSPEETATLSAAREQSCPTCGGLSNPTTDQLAYLRKQVAQEAAGTDPDFLPRYPGSRRDVVTRMRGGDVVLASYHVEDSIGRVLQFYRDGMSQFGWQLQDRMDTDNETLASVLQAAPRPDVPGLEIAGEVLTFTGPRGQCAVSVFGDKAGKAPTQVSIQYFKQPPVQVAAPSPAPLAVTEGWTR